MSDRDIDLLVLPGPMRKDVDPVERQLCGLPRVLDLVVQAAPVMPEHDEVGLLLTNSSRVLQGLLRAGAKSRSDGGWVIPRPNHLELNHDAPTLRGILGEGLERLNVGSAVTEFDLYCYFLPCVE